MSNLTSNLVELEVTNLACDKIIIERKVGKNNCLSSTKIMLNT